MIKKLLAVLIAASMTVSLCTFSVFAEESYSVTDRAAVLKSLGIMQGDPDGNLRLEDNVTRAEFTKMAVAMSSVRNAVASATKVSPFKDVSHTHWSAPYVRLAATNGFVRGYSDFTFRPDNSVTFAEATTMALKLLGYVDEDFGGAWPYGQMGTADNIGLTDDISGDYNAPISRGGCVILLTNLLDTKLKSGQAKYASVVDCEIRESVILVATKNEDPAVANGKIFTTAGTFKMGESSLAEKIGARGDILVRNGEEIVAFTPTGNTTTTRMVVYSTLDNVVIGYVNGQLTQETFTAGTTAYVGASQSTFGAASGRLSMGSVMTIQKDSSGNVEYVSISEGSTLKGPAIVKDGNWYSAYASGLDDYAVIRNGSKATVSALKTNDVAYFAPDLKILFAYANAKTGVYESASPNKDMPTSVKISGVTYQIEGAAAFNALSSTGDIEFGDTVTILLGKDGKIAGVVTGESADSDVYGFLAGAGKKNFTDEKGNEYSSYYINIVLPGGEIAEYITKSNYARSVNNIVRVTFGAGGTKVSSLNAQSAVYGEADMENYTIGTTPVSRDVKILEVSTSSQGVTALYKKVLPKRLDGVNLKDNEILYATKNAEGEIDSMIIEDVTGDLYSYGLMVTADKNNRSYTFDVGGNIYTASGNYTAVSRGMPARFTFAGGNPGGRLLGMMSIYEISEDIEEISTTNIVTEKGNTYTLSDNVGVYLVQTGGTSAKWISLSHILENVENYRISAYYDKKDSAGGRVRIIVASEK